MNVSLDSSMSEQSISESLFDNASVLLFDAHADTNTLQNVVLSAAVFDEVVDVLVCQPLTSFYPICSLSVVC